MELFPKNWTNRQNQKKTERTVAGPRPACARSERQCVAPGRKRPGLAPASDCSLSAVGSLFRPKGPAGARDSFWVVRCNQTAEHRFCSVKNGSSARPRGNPKSFFPSCAARLRLSARPSFAGNGVERHRAAPGRRRRPPCRASFSLPFLPPYL